MNKTCCGCKVEKPLNLFSKNKNFKDGLNNGCKLCCSIRNKNRYKSKKDTIKKLANTYYHSNKSIISIKNKKRQPYCKKNPDKCKQYRIKNKEKFNEYHKEWRKNNKNSYSLRIQVWWWIKKRGLEKFKRTEELLGYSFNEFEEKIGKSLHNYHLDHKIPLSWFKTETPVNIVFHLENLHFIDSKINFIKGNKYNHPICDDYKNLAKQYIKNKYKNKLC